MQVAHSEPEENDGRIMFKVGSQPPLALPSGSAGPGHCFSSDFPEINS